MNHAVFWVTPKSRGDLVGTDPVLAVDDQPRRREPLFQGNGRLLKDRPGLQGESGLFVLPVALPDAGLFEPRKPSQRHTERRVTPLGQRSSTINFRQFSNSEK